MIITLVSCGDKNPNENGGESSTPGDGVEEPKDPSGNEEPGELEASTPTTIVFKSGHIEELSGETVLLDVSLYSEIKISAISSTFTSAGAPSRGNLFIKDVMIGSGEGLDAGFIDLGVGDQDTAWRDDKTYTVDIFTFKHYQIRNKYGGVGVRANHIDNIGDNGLITINTTNINLIQITIFSSVPNLNPNNINVTIEYVE